MIKKRSKNARLIAISSGKGGVGKSNIATNLSLCFAQAGHKVCLLDADINLANINILLGLTPLYTLEHLITEDRALQDIVIKGPSNVDIIAGASGVERFSHLERQQCNKLIQGIQGIENEYDYLIIDTAAGIDDQVLSFLHLVPYLILTITREPTSLTDAFSLIKVLKKQNFRQTVLLVINMVSGRKMAKQIFNRFSEAVSKYLQIEVRLAGYIVYDPTLPEAVNQQQALLSYDSECPASVCIASIASRLLKVFEKAADAPAILSDFLTEQMEDKDSEAGITNTGIHNAGIKKAGFQQLLEQTECLDRHQILSLKQRLDQYLETELIADSANRIKKSDENHPEHGQELDKVGLKKSLSLAAQFARVKAAEIDKF